MKRAKHSPLPKEKVLEIKNLMAAELRLLVSNYYASQQMRKRADMQLRHLGDRYVVMGDDFAEYKPKFLLEFMAKQFSGIEEQIAKAFHTLLTSGGSSYSDIAKWLLAQRGIGPVIATGLIAHFDIEKAPTAGHFWSFAGLNPNMKWEKGQVRPFNAELKQICWHAGQCFMKQSNDPDCFYGHIYRQRKQYEIDRNEKGGNAERAKEFVVTAGATKEVKDKLASGKLPDFNIDDRARRYAVKIFLSHLHAVMFWNKYGATAPLPYSHNMLGHVHFIDIPHAEIFPGMADAMAEARRGIKLAAAE